MRGVISHGRRADAELSNKSFSLKRITDDDGLRAEGTLLRLYLYTTGFGKNRRTKKKETKNEKQIKLDKFYTFCPYFVYTYRCRSTRRPKIRSPARSSTSGIIFFIGTLLLLLVSM